MWEKKIRLKSLTRHSFVLHLKEYGLSVTKSVFISSTTNELVSGKCSKAIFLEN